MTGVITLITAMALTLWTMLQGPEGPKMMTWLMVGIAALILLCVVKIWRI